MDYAFDGLSRMVQASEHTGGAVLATCTYDPLSRRSSFAEGGLAAPTVSYSWTEGGDLAVLTHDLNGSANDVSFDATNGSGVVVGFDEGHRLTRESISNALYQWTGTAAGSTAYSPDRLNRYASVGSTSFTYDANGNLTSDGTWTYAYDPENWLLSASQPNKFRSYLYDPLGRRVQSNVDLGSTVFLHADDEEIGEYGAGGGLQLRYIPGPEIDRPIGWVTSGGAKRFFHADRRGSIIAVTNTSAGVTEGPYSYDAYGAPSATTGTPIKYTGRRYDAETGLYYYRARYYSPGLGRFMQTDPVGYEAGMNLYEYVQDDPVNKTDPKGRDAWSINVGWTGEVGLGPDFYAAAQGAFSVNFVRDKQGRWHIGTTKSGGHSWRAGSHHDQNPDNARSGNNKPFVVGASGGAGVGASHTSNANSNSDLGGRSDQVNGTAAIATVTIAKGDSGTETVGVGLAKGVGASISQYATRATPNTKETADAVRAFAKPQPNDQVCQVTQKC